MRLPAYQQHRTCIAVVTMQGDVRYMCATAEECVANELAGLAAAVIDSHSHGAAHLSTVSHGYDRSHVVCKLNVVCSTAIWYSQCVHRAAC